VLHPKTVAGWFEHDSVVMTSQYQQVPRAVGGLFKTSQCRTGSSLANRPPPGYNCATILVLLVSELSSTREDKLENGQPRTTVPLIASCPLKR
jgi:hypothetical protein